MVNLCIFDLDGLLVDSQSKMWDPNQVKVIESMGFKVDYDLLKTSVGGGHSSNKEKFRDSYGENFDYEFFSKEIYRLNKLSVQNKEVPLKKGAKELLEYLASQNIEMRLGSSSRKEYILDILKANEVDSYFSYIVAGDEVAMQKPDPSIYLKCLKDNDPSTALVFEDAHNGVLASHRAGIRVILVPDTGKLSDEDFKMAYKTLNSLDEAIDIIKLENETTSSI